MLTRLVYFSEAPPGLGRDQVDAILRLSRERNPGREITGGLAWDGRYFVQALEGHRMTLTDLVLRIAADRRNRNLVIVSMREVPVRRFPIWSMADLSGHGVFTGGGDLRPYALDARGIEAHLEEALRAAAASGAPTRAGQGLPLVL